MTEADSNEIIMSHHDRGEWMLNLPPLQLDDIDMKLKLDELVLNVLYVKFGYFYQSMPKHSHSQGSYELHYIPSGKGVLIANGIQYTLTPGTLFMTGPEVEHEQIPDPADPMAEYCIFFEIISGQASLYERDGSKGERLSEWLVNYPFWIGVERENMLLLFELLAREAGLRQIGFHAMITNLLELIITRTIRQYSEDRLTSAPIPVKTLDDSRLVTIENSFLYEYHSITLKQLADRIGLSTRQTERTVYKQYGMCFTAKKLQARMEAAAQLLATTEQTIRDIASAIGFTTPERFSHSFKRYFQRSPSQYRREQGHDS
ncbi:AraC family transcriptional regulator [Paenibacillus campi]|uniref:AraC family transcriptional regulator n=1 Tax=Paenibacillus campi TaxID=3106031 RepID=UPI002AFE5546|nr:AraC family transcriptional regulator [Paenibacillus sp. SGZ-1014]